MSIIRIFVANKSKIMTTLNAVNCKYGLYQTFAASDVPKNDLSMAEKKVLHEKFSTLVTDQAEAVFMLICEHARVNNDFDYDPQNVVLPYSLKQDEANVVIDLENLPMKLRWILWRFGNVITPSVHKQK